MHYNCNNFSTRLLFYKKFTQLKRRYHETQKTGNIKIGSDADNGRLIPVKEAESRTETAVVEQLSCRGTEVI